MVIPPSSRSLYCTFTVVFAFLFSVVTMGTYGAQPADAQSLEERVERLEEQLAERQSSSSYPTVSGIGGRIQADWTFNVDESDDYASQLGDPAEDGFEFRRLWLNASGAISENIDYKVQAGISGGVSLKDVYINVTDLPVLPHLKIGKFKEPYSINEQTSSKYLTFLSRANVQNVFSEGRNPGFLTSNQHLNEKLNWSAGVFTPDTNEDQPLTSGGYNLAARVTSPVYANSDFSQLVHLGLSLGRRANGDATYTNTAGPEVHKGGASLLGIDVNNVQNSDVIGLELATVGGPFSLQGEHSELAVNRSAGEEPTLESNYLMGSYFLTGEKRPYDAASGSFGRVQPKDSYTGSTAPGGGIGAWEVAARWSSTDFSEAKGITSVPSSVTNVPAIGPDGLASEAATITAGLNWYPTAHTRWMVNYVDAQQDDADVDAQWLATRFQVDF